ncbi:MAG: M20/M25/M40 family metallo-hydrolase, partial [Planctomycetota bacterium]|nr:M20/M25/M40 family metallo-hydrolase [Planctomycetota bacterium]
MTQRATPNPEHLGWLTELTSIPTGAGREHRVIAWIERWTAERADLALTRDSSGNITITQRRFLSTPSPTPPIYFTAHLDHPAFVIERIIAPRTIEAAFRGGVLPPYFENARVAVHTSAGPVRATITDSRAADPFRLCTIDLDDGPEPAVGDLCTWDLPPSTISDGILRAPACDDLAAAASALAALDELRRRPDSDDVRILFTLAEEVGFVGAIAACKLSTMPSGARVIALENSRAFADSPIGAGPIVRVGDRMTTFNPALTAAIARLAEKLAGVPDRKVGDATPPPTPAFKWQRKLMPGGACEATAYSAWGYEATCLCLPLGAYHNMGDLDRVQA